jgi:hypothetical protein
MHYQVEDDEQTGGDAQQPCKKILAHSTLSVFEVARARKTRMSLQMTISSVLALQH